MDSVFAFPIPGAPGVGRITNGAPKLVLGATGSSAWLTTRKQYEETGRVPHWTIDVAGRIVYQHIPEDEAAPVLPLSVATAPHRNTDSWWVFIMKQVNEKLSLEDEMWVTAVITDLAEHLGVPENIPTFYPTGTVLETTRMGMGEWKKYSGVVAAAQCPATMNNGPGLLEFQYPQVGAVMLMEIEEDEPEVMVLDTYDDEDGLPPVLAADPAMDDDDLEPEVDLGPFRGKSITLGSKGKKVAALLAEFAEDSDELTQSVLDDISAGLGREITEIDADVWQEIEDWLNHG